MVASGAEEMSASAYRLERDRIGRWWVHYFHAKMHRTSGPYRFRLVAGLRLSLARAFCH